MWYTLNFTASKFVAIFIFMNLKEKVAFSLQEHVSICKKNNFPTITPPKQMQTLLFDRL